MITIIDYNMGNVGSIRNMFKKIGVQSEITSDPERIANARRLVLPGVGAFDAGMENIRRSGLIPILEQRVLTDKVPILGICLGMQLMTRQSEEGSQAGLGWVDADVVKFRPTAEASKVPHMGWNFVRPRAPSALLQDLPSGSRFYFVHSYYVRCAVPDQVILDSHYGIDFASGFERGNIAGVQFHPEKSHKFGMALLSNFARKFP